MLASRRFRNLDESSEAAAAGMKEKKRHVEELQFLEKSDFQRSCMLSEVARSRTKKERKQREKLESLIRHEGERKKERKIEN